MEAVRKNEISMGAFKKDLKVRLNRLPCDLKQQNIIIDNLIYFYKNEFIDGLNYKEWFKSDEWEITLNYQEEQDEDCIWNGVFTDKRNEIIQEREFCCEPYSYARTCAEVYIKDNIEVYNPEIVFDNIKKKYKKNEEVETIEVIDSDKEQYESCGCPICMENWEDVDKQTTNCGHSLCRPCFGMIIANEKKTCPICRADYEEEGDIIIDIENRCLTIDDIKDLQENDPSKLLEMVNFEDLTYDVLRYDSWENLFYACYENTDDDDFLFLIREN